MRWPLDEDLKRLLEDAERTPGVTPGFIARLRKVLDELNEQRHHY